MRWHIGTILLLASMNLAVAGPLSGRLENDAIAWNWRIAEGELQSVSIKDKLNGTTIPLNGECFELVLGDGSILKSSDFKLTTPPVIEKLKPETDSPVTAKHFAGKQITAELAAPGKNLTVEWHVILRDDSTYLRRELALSATGKDVLIKKIILLDEKIPGAETAGTVDGSPVVAGNFFFGY